MPGGECLTLLFTWNIGSAFWFVPRIVWVSIVYRDETQLLHLVVADPRETFRSRLTETLPSIASIRIAASVSTLEAALTACGDGRANIVLLHARVGSVDIREALNSLRAEAPEVRALLLWDGGGVPESLIQAGSWGYLDQDSPVETVAQAVLAVARGVFWAPRRVLTNVVRMSIEGAPAANAGTCPTTLSLTPREYEILQLISLGLTNDEIAVRLYIERTTVKTHIQRLFRKLKVSDRTSAVMVALHQGLLNLASGH